MFSEKIRSRHYYHVLLENLLLHQVDMVKNKNKKTKKKTQHILCRKKSKHCLKKEANVLSTKIKSVFQ